MFKKKCNLLSSNRSYTIVSIENFSFRINQSIEEINAVVSQFVENAATLAVVTIEEHKKLLN